MTSENKQQNIRVRIAPSPTGFAHVGNAYAALFNYAFARKNNGKFILRLEDTDVERNVKGAEEKIYSGLKWLGFEWDEGPDKGGEFAPYRQSERLEIYKKKAKELVKNGLAYEDEGAIRFKNPGKDIGWKDLIRGDITFPGDEVTDFVIVRSNGWPIYNFVVAIDDIEMKITHVIRGEEHISNTPRQIALYKAFGVNTPEFAHLPTLRNKEKKKLSKRRDTVDLRIFKEKGVLPEALVNFLCLLGWSHPEEKEIFGIDEFIDLFSLERVRKAGPVFDTDKLEWMNGQYIQNKDDGDLVEELVNFYDGKYKAEQIKEIVPLVKTRIKTLKEFESIAAFFFERQEVDGDLFKEGWKKHLGLALKAIEKTEKWEEEKLNNNLMEVVENNNFHTGKFFMNLRIAITGNKVTPPINESILILGKDEVLDRLEEILTEDE